MKTAYPYRVLSGDVDLQVDRLFVDNVPVDLGRIGDRDQIVAAQDLNETHQRWSELRLKVSVTADGDEISAGPWRSPQCLVVVSNQRTNVSQAFPLRQDGPGRWQGEVELARDEHIVRSRITARIVATVDGVEGRLVGTAPTWSVDFETKRPTPERSIKMRWIDFTDPSNDHLKEYRDDPWLIDTEAGEPVLYLNSSVDGLRGVLENASSAEQKLVREVMAAQVAAEVWTAMFNMAVYACDVVDGEPQWPGGWHEDVLRRMIPDLYPTHSPEDALAELVQGRAEGENGGDLQRRLMHGAGVHSRKPRKVSTALRDLRRLANKKESV
ncbi:hypothetical protein [Streptomyces sp. MST-110588]|uniref:hypothetical protein n=1 Tax=Streptomyces sp. MST-110588 TaxID=2833628 RepID=UPI001F5C3279|nr:hypothetical protein [Streptomyces sp. MST-110588]UNO41194.1 hypothetical protein KGS77_18460 [Streptomyces sp. MST-110588]